DHAAVGKAARIEFARILCLAGNFGAAVDARGGRSDVIHVAHLIFLCDCDCGVPRAACVSARTMARRASSILNVLCAKPVASRSNRSAACLKGAAFTAFPRSAASDRKSTRLNSSHL